MAGRKVTCAERCSAPRLDVFGGSQRRAYFEPTAAGQELLGRARPFNDRVLRKSLRRRRTTPELAMLAETFLESSQAA
jgi:hypothetical protein